VAFEGLKFIVKFVEKFCNTANDEGHSKEEVKKNAEYKDKETLMRTDGSKVEAFKERCQHLKIFMKSAALLKKRNPR